MHTPPCDALYSSFLRISHYPHRIAPPLEHLSDVSARGIPGRDSGGQKLPRIVAEARCALGSIERRSGGARRRTSVECAFGCTSVVLAM
mmetsp:Transcript_20960/g.39326  ORF Transcript_20960/g.39326 Transcript_20960/m.39326 type:complete len:89 (-) Transcript_20960:136-402(-)